MSAQGEGLEAIDAVADVIDLATKLDKALDLVWDKLSVEMKLDARPGLNLDCREFIKAAKALAADIEGGKS